MDQNILYNLKEIRPMNGRFKVMNFYVNNKEKQDT